MAATIHYLLPKIAETHPNILISKPKYSNKLKNNIKLDTSSPKETEIKYFDEDGIPIKLD